MCGSVEWRRCPGLSWSLAEAPGEAVMVGARSVRGGEERRMVVGGESEVAAPVQERPHWVVAVQAARRSPGLVGLLSHVGVP